MAIVVNGHPTDVYPYSSGDERLKNLFFARQTIVDLESHAIVLIKGVANVNEMQRVLQLANGPILFPIPKTFEKAF